MKSCEFIQEQRLMLNLSSAETVSFGGVVDSVAALTAGLQGVDDVCEHSRNRIKYRLTNFNKKNIWARNAVGGHGRGKVRQFTSMDILCARAAYILSELGIAERHLGEIISWLDTLTRIHLDSEAEPYRPAYPNETDWMQFLQTREAFPECDFYVHRLYPFKDDQYVCHIVPQRANRSTDTPTAGTFLTGGIYLSIGDLLQ